MAVHKKLMQARIALQARKLSKSGHNKFAGYKYFELGDFLPSVMEIFNDLGLCGIVSYSRDTASLRIIDTEDSSEISIESPMGSAALRGVHEVQNIGAVETYQRRYLWVTAMEIVEHDALDAITGSEEKKTKAISATTGVKEALEERLQHQVEKLAAHIQAQFDAGNEWSAFEAWDLRDKTTFDADASTAVWSQLSSKVRSTIKSMSEEAKATA